MSVAFGVVLFARPNIGAITLALLFGLYFMISGFSQIAAGEDERKAPACSAVAPQTVSD